MREERGIIVWDTTGRGRLYVDRCCGYFDRRLHIFILELANKCDQAGGGNFLRRGGDVDSQYCKNSRI